MRKIEGHKDKKKKDIKKQMEQIENKIAKSYILKLILSNCIKYKWTKYPH